MNSALHADYYADDAVQETVDIVANEQIAQDTFRLRFRCPSMAKKLRPGQFLMVRLSHFDDPLIGRPLALYETHDNPAGEPTDVDVVYIVKGKFTSRLQHFVEGQQVDVWGPLGNGFSPKSCDHLVMVAGGVGYTPFLAMTRQYLGGRYYGTDAARPTASSVTFCYGARTSALLAGVDDFRAAGANVAIATDDGTAGFHGLVTDRFRSVLDELPENPRVVCCGPEPMMEAVAKIAEERQLDCEVSLETPMACGIGICFSCVTKVWEGPDKWDYRRTCVEGPVFDAAQICWE